MVRTHSGISPLDGARNTTLYCYRAPADFPSITSILNAPDVREEQLSPTSRVTMQVCFLYHCRIREILNAQSTDIVHPDRVVLHGLKRSNSYVIYLPGLSAQVQAVAANGSPFSLFPISYAKLYRDAVRVGIRHIHKDGKNCKRLHSARYAFVASVSRLVLDSEKPGLMRHRSNKSISYYQ